MFSRTNIPRTLASSSRVPALKASSRSNSYTIQRDLQRRLEVECIKSASRQTVNFSRGVFQARWNSSSSSSISDDRHSQSIFNTPESPWEQLFSGPSIYPAHRKSNRPSESSPRRVEMTAQEQKTFTDLFDEIFKVAEAVDASKSPDETKDSETLKDRIFPSDFYERIRRTPDKPKFGEVLNEELDKKKEEMDLCRTDQELLDWALVHVFAESRRYEEEARELGTQTRSKRNVTLQPLWYSHVIALLMQTFRDKYQNPHTTLAIFNHAKTASIASYAFGCSTDTYNELIQTYWSCFRDAGGVLDAFREMQVNGVTMNSKTGRLLDTIRRDVGAEKLWSDEEVSNIITRLDAVRRGAEGLEVTSKKYRGRHVWDQWKTQALQDDPSDKWGFNNWESTENGARLT